VSPHLRGVWGDCRGVCLRTLAMGENPRYLRGGFVALGQACKVERVGLCMRVWQLVSACIVHVLLRHAPSLQLPCLPTHEMQLPLQLLFVPLPWLQLQAQGLAHSLQLMSGLAC
jgi:hypothetical protein